MDSRVCAALSFVLLAACDGPASTPEACEASFQDSSVEADVGLAIQGETALDREDYRFDEVPCSVTSVDRNFGDGPTVFACVFEDGAEAELELTMTGEHPWEDGESVLLGADYRGESPEGAFDTLTVWVRDMSGRLYAAAHSGKGGPAAGLEPYLSVQVDPYHCRSANDAETPSAPARVTYGFGDVEVDIVGQNRGEVMTPSGILHVEQGQATGVDLGEASSRIRFVAWTLE